jgi:hypothetical protein
MSPDSSSIPPELTRPTPRNVRITADGITSATVATVVLALAAACAVWIGNRAAQTLKRSAILRSDGLTAEGEVLETWRAGRGRGYLVAQYTFLANGGSFTGEADIPEKLEKSFQEESVISIRYLPSDPAINDPAAWEESVAFTWILELVPLMLAALGFRLLFMMRAEKNLMIHGHTAIALVGECTRGRNGFGVTYEFQTADGESLQGCDTLGSPRKEGAEVCILYWPQNPTRGRVYPIGSYRVSD